MEGIFRITSSNTAVRELELHMSQENYPFLKSVKNVHLVSNYWKRIFREMAEPLFPERLYDDFGELILISDDE